MNYLIMPGIRVWVARKPTEDEVIKTVAAYYGLTPEFIKAKGRQRERAIARQMCSYMLKKFTPLSLVSIGEIFNHQDHTTVIHSIKTIKRLTEVYPEMKLDLKTIEQKLTA